MYKCKNMHVCIYIILCACASWHRVQILASHKNKNKNIHMLVTGVYVYIYIYIYLSIYLSIYVCMYVCIDTYVYI